MSRQNRFRLWAAKKRRNRHPNHSFIGSSYARRLHVEALEDRRMLAVISVTSLADDLVVDGSVTLREAVQAANTNTSVDGSVAGSGADTIEFSAALSGDTITLGGTELVITEALTIDATLLAANVTIDANNTSRIINITATTGDFTLAGLTLSGGRTIGNNSNFPETTFDGGAVRSLTTGTLTIDRSAIIGNSTAGYAARGGGIGARHDVTITSSTISENSTAGDNSDGGGIHSIFGDVTLNNSNVSGNSTTGTAADGGGIDPRNLTLINSTVSGNSTMGGNADGGGIFTFQPVTGPRGPVTLINSTVSGNSTTGSGGGIFSNGAATLINSTLSGNSSSGGVGGGIVTLTVSLINSTVSGNSTSVGIGGGIVSVGGVALTSSTVTDNHAYHVDATGGGIYSSGDNAITITNSIVAGNTALGGNPDIRPDTGVFDVNFSLLGTAVAPDPGGSGNLFNDNPLLGVLADNGGLTQTHTLLAGSPAIDAGDPLFDPNAFMPPLLNDQRGAPFVRAAGLSIDIGAI